MMKSWEGCRAEHSRVSHLVYIDNVSLHISSTTRPNPTLHHQTVSPSARRSHTRHSQTTLTPLIAYLLSLTGSPFVRCGIGIENGCLNDYYVQIHYHSFRTWFIGWKK
ncbi:hypothetical protein LWI29_007876 [Acer saccharum]|uniref:Uncharacterized protein n=1 Tax=Acer saccharum TaxID=4024 RepID=A0AA39VDA7_ACESA|nr:hypothetical protein LWI29_007876 [Acer saccharum]